MYGKSGILVQMTEYCMTEFEIHLKHIINTNTCELHTMGKSHNTDIIYWLVFLHK